MPGCASIISCLARRCRTPSSLPVSTVKCAAGRRRAIMRLCGSKSTTFAKEAADTVT